MKSDFELKTISDKIILKERDTLIKNAKNILGGGIGKELYKDVERLINKLPSEGRLSYWSDNLEPYRKDIDYVVNRFIKSDKEINANYTNLKNKAYKVDTQIMEVFGYDENKHQYHVRYDKYIQDIKSRVGNIILKLIKYHNFLERKKEYQLKNRLVEKRI